MIAGLKGEPMSFKDILVYIDGTDASKARDRFAVQLAKIHGAHLAGLAFAPRALLPLYGADVALADMSDVLDGVKAQGKEALARFRACADEMGVSTEERLLQGTSEEFPHDFAAAARLVDLAVLGQPRDGDPLVGQYALVERCIFSSGRPVMIVPAAPTAPRLDGTIIVAWDGSPQAARAISDALTFLKGARRVVLAVGIQDRAKEGARPHVDAMHKHLGRHGVDVEIDEISVSEGADIGRLLLMRAKDLQADMIVMGAFHHSRWREFILGGVTLTMLEEANIPLFMAH